MLKTANIWERIQKVSAQRRKRRGEQMLKELAWNRFYAPEKNVRGQVLVLHGYREGTESMISLVHALVNQGFNVVTADYPGHGQSNGRRGYFRHIDDAVLVCRALAVYLKRKSEGRKLPTYAIGYSTGAMAILAFLLGHRFAHRLLSGVVLISTPLEVTQNSSSLAMRFTPLLSVFSGVFGWMRVPAVFIEKSARKVNGGGLQEHNPMCYRGRPFFRFAIEMFRKSEELRQRISGGANMDMPLCVIHGTEDTRADYSSVERTFKGKEYVDFYPLEDVGHYVWGESPARVNEIVITWLNQQLVFPKKEKRWWFF